MSALSELEHLARQVAAGLPGAAANFRRQVHPVLYCLVRHAREAVVEAIPLGRVVRAFVRERDPAHGLEIVEVPEAVYQLAHALCDRMIEHLRELRVAHETLAFERTICKEWVAHVQSR